MEWLFIFALALYVDTVRANRVDNRDEYWLERKK